MKNVLNECIRVLKWSGRMALNIQPFFSGQFPTHHIHSHYRLSEGMGKLRYSETSAITIAAIAHGGDL